MKQLITEILFSFGIREFDFGTVKLMLKIAGGVIFAGVFALIVYQTRAKKVKSFLVLACSLFVLSMGIRVALIWLSPFAEKWSTDLTIDLSCGRVLSNGINPYIFSDGAEIRKQLRVQSLEYNSYPGKTQEQWDYFASSNLPLELLFFGWIDRIYSKPITYRLVFAVLDSLLPILIFFFLLKFSQRAVFGSSLWSALALSAFSPILLYWGVLFPEDKGVQILFMLGAAYFARSESRLLRFGASPFLLGCSVAFKLLGIFLVPLCLAYVSAREKEKKWITRDQILYCGLFLIFGFIWFIPFLPESIQVLYSGRLPNAVLKPIPQNASIWRSLYFFIPGYWLEIKTLILIALMTFTSWGYLKRRFSLEVTTGSLLLVFTAMFLEEGSLDRANMAIVISMLLIAVDSRNHFRTLLIYYLGAGLALYSVIHVMYFGSAGLPLLSLFENFDPKKLEFLDSVFVLGYVVVYWASLIRMAGEGEGLEQIIQMDHHYETISDRN